jgi:hypothetical protein
MLVMIEPMLAGSHYALPDTFRSFQLCEAPLSAKAKMDKASSYVFMKNTIRPEMPSSFVHYVSPWWCLPQEPSGRANLDTDTPKRK